MIKKLFVESIPGNENTGKDEIVEVVERPSSDNDVKGNIFSKKLIFMQTVTTVLIYQRDNQPIAKECTPFIFFIKCSLKKHRMLNIGIMRKRVCSPLLYKVTKR
jgi:hypothetical protein